MRKRHTPEPIILKLRQAEANLAGGAALDLLPNPREDTLVLSTLLSAERSV